MADLGHIETELILRETEADVQRVYRKAVEETQKKLDDYLRRYQIKDQIKRGQFVRGEITKYEYVQWRQGQLMIGKRWEELRDTLAQDLHNSNNIARSIVQGHMPEVYAVNHNYATFQVEKGAMVDTSYTLYDRQTVERIIRDQPDLLPPPGDDLQKRIAANKDIAWQRGQIQSVTLQSILQGESIPKMARRIAREMGETNYKSTLRYARTAMTGAQNAGRVDGYKRAQSMGINLEQEWLATLDGRTRHSHRQMDGQHVKVGEKFSNGCRFPGDPDGPGSEIWNCRCTLVPRIEGIDQSDAPRNSKLGSMSYEEWKTEKAPLVSYERKERTNPVSIGGLREPIRPRKADFENEDDYYAARDEYRAERERYNASLQEIVDNTIEAGGFHTIEDVKAWASERGILISDEALNSISVGSFSAVRPALDEMFRRFPEVKSFSFESFDGSMYKTDFRIGIAKEGLLSANGGFNFNVAYFGDGANEYGIKDGLMGIMDKRLVFGDGSFSTLVRHEYGHNVQEYIEVKLADKYHYHTDDWRKHYKTFDEYDKARNAYFAERRQYETELMQLAGLPGSSGYSNTNTLELFAEGFAEWSSGGESEFGRAFGEFLRRWY